MIPTAFVENADVSACGINLAYVSYQYPAQSPSAEPRQIDDVQWRSFHENRRWYTTLPFVMSPLIALRGFIGKAKRLPFSSAKQRFSKGAQ